MTYPGSPAMTLSYLHDESNRDTDASSLGGPLFQYDLDGDTTHWSPSAAPTVEGRADAPSVGDRLTTLGIGGGLLGLLPPSTYLLNASPSCQTSVSSSYTYQWDDLCRLTACDGPTLPRVNSGYGADGLRAWSYTPANSVRTFYVYDGDTLLGEVSADQSASPVVGAVTAAYTWGAAGLVSERLLNRGDGQGGTVPDRSLWYHFGPQGETRQLTDATGAVVDAYAYTAYGVTAGQTGNNDPNPFQYGGQDGYYAVDPSAGDGLYLCGQRWYVAALGRFLSRDPIGYSGGDNLYAYCIGNPVRFVDNDGFDPIVITSAPKDKYKHVPFWISDAFGPKLQKQMADAVRKILKTKRGRQICSINNPYVRNEDNFIDQVNIFPIIDTDDPPNAEGNYQGGNMYVDYRVFNYRLQTVDGPRTITPLQVVAHELGHVLTGVGDDDYKGHTAMENVILNENPITREYGYPARSTYGHVIPPKGH